MDSPVYDPQNQVTSTVGSPEEAPESPDMVCDTDPATNDDNHNAVVGGHKRSLQKPANGARCVIQLTF